MTPPRDGPGITGTTPQDAVCAVLLERYEYFTRKEQRARKKGDDVNAEGAHYYATLVLRAYAAETR